MLGGSVGEQSANYCQESNLALTVVARPTELSRFPIDLVKTRLIKGEEREYGK
jgi:hypothetical protein